MKFIKKAKVTFISLFVWLLAVGVFLGTSAFGAKPDGFYQGWQNITFFVSMIVGTLSFLVFIISFLIKLWLRSKLLAVLMVVLAMMFPLAGGAFIYGAVRNQQVSGFTGQDLFNAVNKYRVANGVAELKLDQALCPNLTQRWFDNKAGLKEGIAHKNWEQWYKKYIPEGYYLSEDYAFGRTPDELVKSLAGSPGHRLSILDPKNVIGCSYAYEGSGVIILGYHY